MFELSDLNDSQREAVLYNEGPLLVFAGAGSGKTRVITYKIAYLIDELQISPHRILAVTFTNKAASEMKARTEALLKSSVEGLWIGTFHSICAKILRRDISILGFKSNFSILDEDDSLAIVKDSMKALNIDPKYTDPNAIKDYISKAKTNFIDCIEFRKIAGDYFDRVVLSVYEKYTEILKKSNSLDFDDLIYYTLKLFKEHEEVLNYYQKKFKYVLVDEYQDVSKNQYEFVKLIAGKSKKLTLVGDDDQSIYSFRGASVEFIDAIMDDFKSMKVIKLEKNYRSTQEILDIANKLIKNNKHRAEKMLYCDKHSKEGIIGYEAVDELDEARYVVGKIKELTEKGEYKFSEIAVLYRMNSQSRSFEEYLIREGIPYQVIGGVKFYNRSEIKDIIAYLALINNPFDDISFKRIINIPSRKIGENTLKEIEEYAFSNNVSFFEAIETMSKREESTTAKKVLSFYELIKELKEDSIKLSLTRFVEEVISKTRYLSYIEEKYKIDAESRIENVREFVNMVAEFSRESEENDLNSLLMRISLVTNIDEKKDINSVFLMTLHAAKGLEFPVVFLVGLEEGYLPHYKSLESLKDIEEERRLCYVGITRAKERIYFTFANRRTKFGNFSTTKPSRFLNEIGIADYFEKNEYRDIKSFNTGDIVLHKIWGLGKILDIIYDTDVPFAVVDFIKIGKKNLDLRFAPLEKIEKEKKEA